MQLDIQIDSNLSEEVIRISAPQMTEELQQVIASVEKIYQQKKLIVMEDKSVCAVMTTGERLRLGERLYQLEEWLVCLYRNLR
ncbi:hypothetical protein ERX37_06110 [Macrococcus hajekii]|uniref:Uncharacterized protein n=1 Tax=Macrococcus hajekii TaxID=198482 RepID=A0A4R6BJA7_9STAP|nr:hypothetical protein [Macrococcus hajekii]TDM01782.1 hypothetical protein ERX37_06110 [Macrococcus hajekii]GGB07409.1 hypothetical protein GCM10007190_14270 [Macrococcus hajekii]